MPRDLPIDEREAIALAEMAATRVAPGVARTMIAVFAAVIFVVPVVQIAREWSQDGGPLTLVAEAPSEVAVAFSEARQSTDFSRAVVRANREAQRQIGLLEDAIEDETWLSERVRGTVQLVLTGVFGVGNQQTHIGRDGWLFYSPDLHYVTGPGFLEERRLRKRIEDAPSWETPPQPDPRTAILDFKRQLDARGITLVVMPVPGKTTVQPERLSPGYLAEPPLQNRSFASFVADLEAAGVIVFDAARIIAGLRSGGADVYLATDTHWRPEVVKTVAESLSGLLFARTGLSPGPVATYRVQPEPVANVGDLAVMLDLPEESNLFPPEPATISRVVDEAGSPWRPAPGAEVLLLGDSFTNIYALASMGWGSSAGLAEHLSMALGRPVDRIVQNDQGSHATRELLARQLAERPDRLDGVRVVIYQFATRELAIGDWRIVNLGN